MKDELLDETEELKPPIAPKPPEGATGLEERLRRAELGIRAEKLRTALAISAAAAAAAAATGKTEP